LVGKKKYQPQELVDVGLILKRNGRSGYYDRFRGRLTFPLTDMRGKVLGFSGRVLPGEGVDEKQAKYINSPETVVYKKSQHLYGLNFAKSYIREKGFAIIVEGYIDVVMSHQYGINNTISSLGTALTLEQIRLLRRYTHNIVMVYDADQAGELATLRGLDLFLEEGMNVKVAILDQGHDPDSFIRKFGPRGFNTAIKKAKSLFTYKLDILNNWEELIMQAIGEASMCWSDIDKAGVFDSSRAERIGKKLLANIKKEKKK